MHFHHLAIRVRDLDKSVAFYETIAQLKVTRRYRYEDIAEIAYMGDSPEATQVELIHMFGQSAFEGQGLTVCFETDELDAFHALAAQKGMRPSDIRNPDPENRYFFVYDPDGVSVQLKQIMR